MGVFNALFGQDLIFRILAIVIGLTLHEFGHAAVAVLLGDNTPREQGRLTLNPLAHLDVLGLLMILFSFFGWARPVQFNPRRFRIGPRLGIVLVALAGPLMNIIVAIVSLVLLRSVIYTISSNSFILLLLTALASVNIALAVFNLVPVPPLDGWNVVSNLFPLRGRAWVQSYERVGPFLMLLIVLTPIGGTAITYVIQNVASWFGAI